MALDTTLGGASANSYVTQAEAESYFSGHPYASTWAFDEDRLKYATILLDSLVSWRGLKWYSDQAREFPRATSTTFDSETILGYEGLGSPYIPSEIKNAQCELDLYLLNNSSTFLPENSIDSVKVGPIEVDFNQDRPGSQDLLPPIVQAMVSKYGSVKRSGATLSSATLIRS